MKVNLERFGAYSVRTENHASRALETARHFHPDLIFLDVSLAALSKCIREFTGI
jgi:CheY-like chemotaxis protein